MRSNSNGTAGGKKGTRVTISLGDGVYRESIADTEAGGAEDRPFV
jgi:hypothetical protein